MGKKRKKKIQNKKKMNKQKKLNKKKTKKRHVMWGKVQYFSLVFRILVTHGVHL